MYENETLRYKPPTVDLTNIYQHRSPRNYLSEVFTARQTREPEFSLRQWAKEMGISHTLLSMLVQGKRPIRLKHFPALARGIPLTQPERLYFQALIEFDSATTPEQKNLLQLWLSDMHPGGPIRNIELETFRAISDWIHFGLISYCSVKRVKNQPQAIARRFGGKVPTSEIRSAIDRLLELNLLTLSPEGELFASQTHTSSRNDTSDHGVREYHRQVASLAQDAVMKQEPSEREFQALSLPMNPEKLNLAKEMIRRFRYQFCEAMGVSPESNEEYDVYQMNLHFFRLTERPSEKSRIADEGAGYRPAPPQERPL